MTTNRRRYLARAGAGLGVVALAGCLGTLAGEEGETEDADVPDRTGERALDRSVGELNQAVLAMAVDDLEDADPETVDFDPSEPREHLERARDHIETAEAELDGREDDLEELRAYADVLEVLIDIAAVVADETIADDVERISAALADGDDDEADLDAAQEIVGDRAATLEESRARYDSATSDLVALDEDRLEDLAVVDLSEVESGAAELGTVLAAQNALASGYETLLEGYDDLETGREHADGGDYEAATTAFVSAESAFGDASDAFESGNADAPAGFGTYFETALCRSRYLEEAADHFASASAAAADGDVTTARRRQREGEDALEAARACGD